MSKRDMEPCVVIDLVPARDPYQVSTTGFPLRCDGCGASGRHLQRPLWSEGLLLCSICRQLAYAVLNPRRWTATEGSA
jgi:hypothetical protein